MRTAATPMAISPAVAATAPSRRRSRFSVAARVSACTTIGFGLADSNVRSFCRAPSIC
jgi:hypothetical protein